MPDTTSHDATRRDDLHTMTARQLEAKIMQAGIVMSYRQVLRHCEAGTFDARRLPGVNNVTTWFVAPASVERGIADLKVLQADRDATRHDVSTHDKVEAAPKTDIDMTSHDETRHDVSMSENKDDIGPTQSDTTRHVMTDFDALIQHPYVKRLEREVDEYKIELKEQRQRTEQLLIDARKDFVTLAQNSQVAQSQTLADFFLKAREWMLGRNDEIGGRNATDTPTL